MKEITRAVFIAAALGSFALKAQYDSHLCSNPSMTVSGSAASAPPQPTNCAQLLSDLVPTSLDPTLEVSVNFWVFKPSTWFNTAPWTHNTDPTTLADVQQCLSVANSNYTALAAPTLTVPGVTSITNARIKLVLKSLNYVTDNQAFGNIDATAAGAYGYQWHDPTAINVLLGINQTTYVVSTSSGTFVSWMYGNAMIHAGGASSPGVYPNNWIVFTPQFNTWGNPNYDNIRHYGITLSHEAGHVLGLDHTTYRVMVLPNTPPTTVTINDQSMITPTFGCCSNVEALDLVKDDGYWNPCPGVTVGTVVGSGGNNIMSQNTACGYRYLSPHQIAVVQYNLRTVLKDFLTASSYTAATYQNSLFNYNVTSDETWASGDRYMKGTVRVKAGKTLTIKCGVAFTKGARIIVENGAQLVIDGGHVTNISGRTWRGIEVMGNPAQSQSATHPTNVGALLYQGVVRVKNGGKVSHADIGVSTHLGNGVAGNGVVITDNAIFENNVIDAEFMQASNVTSPMASISKFVRSQFITTGPVGEFAQVPNTHVSLKNTTGVQFLGCTFKFDVNTAGIGTRGNGISSTDATYFVNSYATGSGNYPSTFEYLTKGVYVNNVNPLKVPTIINTTFREPGQYGAYFLNTHFLAFKTNTVEFGSYYGMAGVYLNNCKYYKISNNTFIEPLNLVTMDQGLNIYRSKTGTHEVFNNTFSNIFLGINCLDDNSGQTNFTDGLKMYCNIFDQVPNQYDIALTHTSGLAPPTVMFKQGETNTSLMTPTNLVRNLYGASCGNQNKWSVHSTSTKLIDHGCNQNGSGQVTVPLPQPGCSSSLLNVVTSANVLNYTVDCVPSPASSGGNGTNASARISYLNDYISNLKSTDEEERNHFEIQASVSSKLYEFIADTLEANQDSVIAILSSNQGEMEDADVQTVFAYLAKNDYDGAQLRTNDLGGHRQDWKDYFNRLIQIRSEDDGDYLACSDPDTYDFFGYYSANETDPQASAQALLYHTCAKEYTEPHALPEGEGEGERGAAQNSLTADKEEVLANGKTKIFPNPNSGTFYVMYQGKLEPGAVSYKITDLLGKTIVTGQLSGNSRNEISTNSLDNGIYFVSLIQRDRTISKEKLVISK